LIFKNYPGKMEKQGKLYLIPSPLAEDTIDRIVPEFNENIIRSMKFFIVEELRTARRFIKKIDRSINIDDLRFEVLNEHSSVEEIPELIELIKSKKVAGLMSEAGLPCIADPGAKLVRAAQLENIEIIPLTGPSSIFLALMASGFNGQSFCFHGYLPVDRKDLINKIRSLEQSAFRQDQTQIFIEAPYRNMKLFDAIISSCANETKLCIAVDITAKTEWIKTKSISQWRKQKPELHKRPVVFLLY